MGLRKPLPWNRSLRLKILAVAGVPVLALALSTTTFLLLLKQETDAEQAVSHSVAIRQATQEVATTFQAMNGAIWGETLGFGPSESLSQSHAALTAALGKLRQLTANDQESFGLLADFETKVAAQIAISRGFVEEIERTGRIPKLSPQVIEGAETLTESPQIILDRIAKRAEDSVARRSEVVEEARDRVVTVVVAAGAAGTAGGLALIAFAGTGIVRRVRKLGGNAQRLAEGEQLVPFDYGKDEIGSLGRELEEAADLLAEREVGMRKATEDAERANKAKSEFLSRMSHELRTPLNSILGFGQLLEMTELTDEAKDDVQHILRAGRHLLLLIDEVLDISGIEAGAVRFSIEPVCVGDVFDEVIALTRPIAEKSDVTVKAVPASDVWVRADRQRVKQVVLNLVANGIKYNRRGGSVSLEVESVDGSTRLNVADTGRGLSASEIEQLFVPFQRLGAEQMSIEGTGLGLALSQRLVEGMGGEISVASTPGSGSVFTVVLASADAPLGPEDEEGPQEREREPGQPVVLYIEDNLANLKLIERVLAKSPVRLMSAMKGTLGVELAAQHRPDVILLDLHLPDIPGEEVLRQLRADDRTAGIPVIVISADATPNHAMRSMDTAAFLTKPLDVPQFLEAFDSVLASRTVA